MIFFINLSIYKILFKDLLPIVSFLKNRNEASLALMTLPLEVRGLKLS